MNKLTKSTVLAGMLGASTIALAMAMSTSAYAQSTSSAVGGIVTGSDGAPISGASVTILHVSTGRVATATTTANGAFSSRGLRVGGPYTITVTAPGARPEVKERLFFAGGDTARVDFDLEALGQIDEIIVVGRRIADISLNNGAGSAFSASDVENQPSVDRDLTDTLLRDPLTNSDGGVGNLIIGGQNPKFNAIAIDGVFEQDDFGLSNNTFSGNRSPISLDTIESVSIVASDYSVLMSGFQGGLVNVVTKSGTNNLDGTAFYERSGSSWSGNKIGDTDVDLGDFTEESYGGTIGGPIIKDKLFFFGSYEKFKTAIPVTFEDRDIGPGAYAALAPFIETAFGFDPGVRPDVVSNPTTNEKILAKIDWEINADHRASFSYRNSKDASQSVGNRFLTANYQRPIDVDTFSAQLYSNWSENFSTEFRIGKSKKVLGQICNAGPDLGEVRVRLDSGDLDLVGTPLEGLITGRATFTAGCDRFRHANSFEDQRLQMFGSGTYLMGNHTITAGIAYQDYDLQNFFVERSRGQFTFNSLTDLINRTGDVSYRNAQSNDVNDASAAWGFQTLALFAQDEWQVSPDLRLNAGLRYETFIQGDETPLRTDFQTAYGRSSQNNLDGVSILLPRVGFNYTPYERTTVSGGFGLFAGSNPLVWISNAYQPQIFSAFGANLTNLNPANVPQVLLDQVAASNAASSADIDLVDPNFKTPSIWKASLKVEQGFDANWGGLNLGDDYLFTAQYLYSKSRHGFRWENLAQTQLAGISNTGVAPDGRIIYADLDALDVRDAVQLTNSTGGRGHVFTVGLAKEFDFGGAFNANYTYADVETVTPGTSSRGISSLRATVGADRNNPAVGLAPFNTRHKFGINLSYENEVFADLTSRIDIFGNIFSGEPYSYTFDVDGRSGNNLFGRSSSGAPFDNDLLYIPTISGGTFNDSNVVFAGGFDQQGFVDFINANSLETGRIAERNAQASAWNQLWNLSISQELPFGDFGQKRFEGNTLKVFLTIRNFPNMLNSNWGTRKRGSRFDTIRVVRADLVSAADVAVNGVDGATALRGDDPRTTCITEASCLYRYTRFRADGLGFIDLDDSVYKAKLGIKYTF
ncbi:MAG: carboxypeptidase regulatory-like domain-containing protein [Robiginitomaculum sp.]|nr:carboxypeptidase regulatory-like domain-containing protein [Robiginitomaculum sp.]